MKSGMKASELRCGNLIKIDGIVVQVDARTIFDFDSDGRVKEPIPLTEEWLLNKCGAIKWPDKFGGFLLPLKSVRILKDESGFYHLTCSPFEIGRASCRERV